MEDNFEQEHYLDVVSKQRLSPDECRHILERLSMEELMDERPTIGAISEATGVEEGKVIALLAEVRGEAWREELETRLIPIENSVEDHENRINLLEMGRSTPVLPRRGTVTGPRSNRALGGFLAASSLVFAFVLAGVIMSNSETTSPEIPSVSQAMVGIFCSATMYGPAGKEFCIDTKGVSWVNESGVRRELTTSEMESSEYATFLWSYHEQKQSR